MSKITDSARGEECTLRLPGICSYDREQTVWAHANILDGGKALGKKLKRVDHLGAYACYFCHMILDGQAPRPAWMTRGFVLGCFERGMDTSRLILVRKGLWPKEADLATKPVRRARPITKRPTAPEDDAREKRRWPSRPMKTSGTGESRASYNWPSRELKSANRLQSRPFPSQAKGERLRESKSQRRADVNRSVRKAGL
ncbi:nuclease domain-containing protein [Paraburkholderia sp. J10-1]|uniref:nuclease domain-containing protein n=1 Tax=Paraburkholderia sp. J10-1 TaxID=2805430 RepID=UPI002AB6A3F3|nr:nuclease domain-containing protein [Paraburkholderia sp. J10-1]